MTNLWECRQAPLRVLMEASPNRGGVEFAAIDLTPDVRTRLFELVSVARHYMLDEAVCSDLPVAWNITGLGLSLCSTTLRLDRHFNVFLETQVPLNRDDPARETVRAMWLAAQDELAAYDQSERPRESLHEYHSGEGETGRFERRLQKLRAAP